MKNIFYKTAKYVPDNLLNILIKTTNKKLILPFYHVVSDDYIPHIKNLYNYNSIKQFEKSLDYLLKFYEPIDIEDINKTNNKKAFHLSFDDGLREFKEIIVPILLKKGIPATCFLNNNFIDNKEMFFRHKISLIIEELKSENFSINKTKKINSILNLSTSNHKYSIIRYLKNNKHILDKDCNLLCESLDIDINHYLNFKKPYLTSDEIVEISKKGFNFGAHTADHHYINVNFTKNQIKSLNNSIEDIKLKYKQKNYYFAYPFDDIAIDKTFFNQLIVSDKGFSFGTSGLKNDEIKNNFQRIDMEYSDFNGNNIILGEYLYYILKGVINKNHMKR